MSRNPSRLALASFDVRDCSYRGRALDLLEPDQRVEEKFFPGWRNALAASLGRFVRQRGASLFNLVEDGGLAALEWSADLPMILVHGDEAWSDLTVATEMRCMTARTFPYFHDEATHDFQGRTGIAFRLQDARRHYFAGFQDGRSAVLAAREDGNWIVLNRADFRVDLKRYYRLELRAIGGRFEFGVDGETILIAEDRRWARGPAGVYSNCAARWRNAEVSCSAEEGKEIERRRQAAQRSLASARRAVPQPVVLEEVALPGEDETRLAFEGLLAGTDRLLLRWTRGDRVGLAVSDRKGREAWRRDLTGDGRQFLARSADMDLDGAPEVVVFNGAEMLVLDGASGRTKHAAPYPDGCPYLRYRGEKALFAGRAPYLWRTAGLNRPARIVAFEYLGAGGYTIMCFDHTLRRRWVHYNAAGKAGHNIQAYDVDGDGRLEVVAGYYCLNDEGEVVWRVKDQDLIYKQDHTDNLEVGPMGPDGTGIPKVVAVCGEAGALFLDARNGNILVQRRGLGHCQRCAAGRFLHDGTARQVWVWTDWGCAGVFYLFDEDGRILHRMQPDSRCANAQTVTWWPDGRDLLMLLGTRETQGLWDAHGRRVVDLAERPLLPDHARPTATGFPIRNPFTVCRFPGETSDRLALVDGGRLLFLGPEPR